MLIWFLEKNYLLRSGLLVEGGFESHVVFGICKSGGLQASMWVFLWSNLEVVLTGKFSCLRGWLDFQEEAVESETGEIPSEFKEFSIFKILKT